MFCSGLDSRVPKFGQFPFQLVESKVLSSKADEKLTCCNECMFNFEKEALFCNSEIKDISNISTQTSSYHKVNQTYIDSFIVFP